MKKLLLTILLIGIVGIASAALRDIHGNSNTKLIRKGEGGTIFWVSNSFAEGAKLQHLSFSGVSAADWIAVYDIALTDVGADKSIIYGNPVFCLSTFANGPANSGFTKTDYFPINKCLVIRRIDTDVSINVMWEDLR